jgi:hypothetical protein
LGLQVAIKTVFPVANDEDAEMNFLYLQREINILKYLRSLVTLAHTHARA